MDECEETYPNVEAAVEPVAELPTTLTLVSGKEPVGSKLEARIGGLGAVEGGEDELRAQASMTGGVMFGHTQ